MTEESIRTIIVINLCSRNSLMQVIQNGPRAIGRMGSWLSYLTVSRLLNMPTGA